MMGNDNPVSLTLQKPSTTLQTGALLSSPVEGAPAWFAVRVVGNRERKVQEELGPRVREVVCPIVVDRNRQRRMRKDWAKLYLPGFVFFRQVLTDELWHVVHKIRGIAGFVGTVQTRKVSGRIESYVFPARVPDRQMQVLLDQMNAEGVIERAAALPADLKDRLLRVLDGPFTSFDGICEWHDRERCRVSVGVNMFGRIVPVELDDSAVEPV